ncbi:MAG: glycosyltransferase [Bacteroidaceae bacterium]|jgi:glycosyltransferase involved in cell wall biosynthesis|nr:glycosyltransferase [Bacteroidaceae bacterium]
MSVVRILQILSNINCDSGATILVLNWHKNIDREKIQFDYLYFLQNKDLNFENEIKELGGNIYKLPYPSLFKPWIFIKAAIFFFKNHKYSILHSHLTQLNFFYFPIAKFYGTKNIIVHSHSTIYSSNKLKSLTNKFLFFCSRKFINYKIAISKNAGDFLFGKKSDYFIIHNGIDTENFSFNNKIRNAKRLELKIEDNFVIGHVGRFSKEKNHILIIKIFKELYKKNPKSILLLSGNGQLEKEIKQKIKDMSLSEQVIFTGIEKNINQIYQAMDVFLFPSLNEGFGLSLMEAQCSGLPCFISNTIPAEAVVVNTTVLPLCAKPEIWAEKILSQTFYFKRKNESIIIKDKGFHITETVNKIQNFYLQITKQC